MSTFHVKKNSENILKFFFFYIYRQIAQIICATIKRSWIKTLIPAFLLYIIHIYLFYLNTMMIGALKIPFKIA